MKKLFILILYFVFSWNFPAQENPEIITYLHGIKVTDLAYEKGNLWIATKGNGLYQFLVKEERIKNFSTKNRKLSNDLFFSIAIGEKFIYAGSIDGLFIYDKRRRRWTKRKFGKGGQLGNYIRDIYYDKEKNVAWIGRFQFLTKFDARKRRFKDYDLTRENNLKANSIIVLKKDAHDNLWVGTDAGLYKLDLTADISQKENRIFYDKRLNYFPNAGETVSVSSLLFEREYVWIGTNEFVTKSNPEYNNGGLYRFDGKIEWLRFDEKNGLPGNGISALERIGNYIFAAVYQFGKETKKEFGRGIAIINRMNGKTATFVSQKISGRINALLFDGKFLWAGGEDGLYKIKIANKLFNWSN